ncbi:unnamed protein product, partial [Durusdinium trenchii]
MDDEPEVTHEDGGRGPSAGGRPRGPVTGGWGFDDGGTSSTGPRMSAEPPSPPARKGHFEEDDDAVPTIPDLEEEAEEDITRQVAAPPVAAPSLAPPVRTVRELEGALNSRGTLPASPEEGVDLAPLMQCLCSDRQVFEQDSTWDHELIFQEVASAINQDMLGDGEGIESEEMDNMQRLPRKAALTRVPRNATMSGQSDDHEHVDRSYERETLSWSEFKSGRVALSTASDVVIVDRAKYAGNIGSILRHMPILGGAQVLFLANSSYRLPSPYPVYTRGFLKEVMRVSMARNYEDFGSKLCVLEGDGKEELIDLLQRLKALGFKLLLLENREVFQDPRLVGCTAESIFQHPLMEDLGAPLAFIFGGEVGQLLPEVLLYCDAAHRTHEHGHEPTADAVDVHPLPRLRTHSCNVSVAACVVLSERFRWRYRNDSA